MQINANDPLEVQFLSTKRSLTLPNFFQALKQFNWGTEINYSIPFGGRDYGFESHLPYQYYKIHIYIIGTGVA